jgi:hypothetical protein
MYKAWDYYRFVLVCLNLCVEVQWGKVIQMGITQDIILHQQHGMGQPTTTGKIRAAYPCLNMVL